MRPDELERQLRARLDALGPTPRDAQPLDRVAVELGELTEEQDAVMRECS